jgi:hypothetical protein
MMRLNELFVADAYIYTNPDNSYSWTVTPTSSMITVCAAIASGTITETSLAGTQLSAILLIASYIRLISACMIGWDILLQLV